MSSAWGDAWGASVGVGEPTIVFASASTYLKKATPSPKDVEKKVREDVLEAIAQLAPAPAQARAAKQAFKRAVDGTQHAAMGVGLHQALQGVPEAIKAIVEKAAKQVQADRKARRRRQEDELMLL